MKKIAIISHVVPPQSSGQAVILGRLLQQFAPSQLIFITNQVEHSIHTNFDIYFCNTYLSSIFKYISYLPILFFFYTKAEIFLRSKKIQQIVFENNITTLVVCSGDLFNMPAATKVCKNNNIELIPYFFDDYIYQWKLKFARKAAKYEADAISFSKKSIAPNEYIAGDYKKRYGVDVKVIRNLSENSFLANINNLKNKNTKLEVDKLQIGFLGSVYHANYDAFLAFFQALKKYDKISIKFKIYTSINHRKLEKLFIEFNHIIEYSEHLEQKDIPTALLENDVLYLPLGFNTGIEKVIRSSAPGKLAEYLYSSRPIIAHVPGDSFVTWYFRKNNFPYLINSQETNKIISVITKIIADKKAKRDYSFYLQSAKSDFDPQKNQKLFRDYIFGE
ncbi:MAG: hypothetical protein H6696_07360 [Deferribacteres bacterium]|nr:hypothetical protein [Deferribacteres bacterium]